MKKLLMLLLVHINPNAIFSQSIPVEKMAPNTRQFIPGKNGDGDTLRVNIHLSHRTNEKEVIDRLIQAMPTPDTLRALILATMCRRCAAEPIRGFVVIEQGKRPVYLDCRKRALKYPQVGWRYEIVGGKEK